MLRVVKHLKKKKGPFTAVRGPNSAIEKCWSRFIGSHVSTKAVQLHLWCLVGHEKFIADQQQDEMSKQLFLIVQPKHISNDRIVEGCILELHSSLD